jgi:hypothetical protein
MNPDIQQAKDALTKARNAFHQGDRRSARRWAEKAATLAPHLEDPWLILAALSTPRASLAYLERALEINPQSTRARKGMHWAINRWRNRPRDKRWRRNIVSPSLTSAALRIPRRAILPWALVLLTILVGVTAWFGAPAFNQAVRAANGLPISQVNLDKATFTPTPTNTPTPTPTDTPTNTPTPTDTYTPRPPPTWTPIPPTPIPPTPQPPEPGGQLPPGVNPGERWIDVNLSAQRLYTYQGLNLINSFWVSTGTWQHPTLTGQYRIYVKYRYADMRGPGYYLPNVPFVMYYYKGYGIHGTYWHNNFGTPMSHGCINLSIPDSEWVYNWASVGTLVNIHY